MTDKCKCSHEDSSVVDVRVRSDGRLRRRRHCKACGAKKTTIELDYDDLESIAPELLINHGTSDWTSVDLKWLKEFHLSMPIKEIARRLGRTEGSVYQKLWKLNHSGDINLRKLPG